MTAHAEENSIPETQASVASWAESTFGPVTDNRVLVERAMLELQELLEAVAEQDHTGIGNETADVIILLMRLLHNHDIDMQEAITAKMRTNRTRTWNSDGNGTGSHIA